MKTTLPLPLACAFFALAAPAAPAGIIGVETFDYADAALAGQSGGTFWDFKNVAPTGHDSTASDWDNEAVFGPLPAVANGRLVTSIGGARREYNGPGEGPAPSDEADGAVNGVNVHRVVYFRVTFTTGATLPNFFGVSSYDFGNERIFFGKPFNQPNFGFTVINDNATVDTGIAVQPNTTYTLAGRVDYASDTVRLFVNPDLNAGEPVGFGVPFTRAEPSTALRLASGSNDPITWDNLVVATSWEDLGTAVTTAADTDDGSLDPALGGGGVSLREAVKYSPNGSLVTFDPTVLNGATVTFTGGDIVLPGALTVDASDLPRGVTLDANHASRHFFLPQHASLTARGLTLTRGNGTGNGDHVGGAIFSYGHLRLTRCSLVGNTAGSGGALWQDTTGASPSARLDHCTVAENRGTDAGSGGGLDVVAGSLTLTRCTVSRNVGRGGGGGIFLRTTTSVSIADCLIAENRDPVAHDIRRDGGTFTASGVNFIGSNATVGSFFPPGPLVGTQAAPVDPKLMPLGDYGGPTPTLPPLAGSPAVDAGAATSPSLTDQRGFPRVADGNNSGSAQVDVGAVESAFRFVTNNADAGAGSLRQAIADCAGRSGFEAIAFAASLDGGTISLHASGPSALDIIDPDGVSIDASGLGNGLTLTKPAAGNYRLLRLTTGALSLHGLTLTGGSPTTSGGAIASTGSLLVLNRCTLFGNSGGRGGAIFSSHTVPLTTISTLLLHCTLTGNAATATANSDGGGAIFNNRGRTVLRHCTITGNTAAANQGAVAGAGASDAITEVESTIIAGNPGGDVHFTDGSNSFHSLGRNLIGNGNGLGAFSPALGDLVGVADPRLAPLAPRGGPTRTMPPLPGSPAIDAAPGSLATADQRGFPRNAGDTGAPDIGAVERGPVLTVLNDTDADAGSLRATLAAAVAPDTRIRFAPGLDGRVIRLTSAGLFIPPPQNVELDATALPAGLTISGDGAWRLLFNHGILALHRLTLRDGRAPTNEVGGGLISAGTLLAVDCTVSNNAAPATAAGGVFLFGGTADLLRCTFARNVSGSGGAFVQQGPATRATLTQCTFADNAATGSAAVGGLSALEGTLDLRHCTVTRNAGLGGAGGMYLQSPASVRLDRCVIAGNTASPGAPADVFFLNGTLNRGGPSLLGSNQTVASLFPAGPLAGTAAAPLVPRLAPLGDYGGPTPTVALRPGSPARDAADTGGAITADQRRFPIIGTPDLGAYEAGTLDANFAAFIWETLPADATEAQHAANFDFDGDGAGNRDEWLAGTGVTDARSVFRLTSLVRTGPNVFFTFPTVAGRIYRFETSPDLLTWTPFPGNVQGDGNLLTLSVSAGNAPRFFVRPRVGPP